MVVYLTIADDSSTLRQLASQPMAEKPEDKSIITIYRNEYKIQRNDLTETRRKFCLKNKEVKDVSHATSLCLSLMKVFLLSILQKIIIIITDA